MEGLINDDIVCVLRENAESSQIEVGYVKIVNSFEKSLNLLREKCNNQTIAIAEILRFLKGHNDFDRLNATYKYCKKLKGSYQGFTVDNQEEIEKLGARAKLIKFNYENNPNKYDLVKAVNEFKDEIVEQYCLWCHAFSINQIYRRCFDDPKILTFSHRICGWSNPLHQLTSNFSVEILTNFGYGPVSYFYTKLRYKNIEITPMSEWISYEKAKFAEIIRYSKKHSLENSKWLEAMEFAKEACNLSREDELQFVSKYVMEECEKMVEGLEFIMIHAQFKFKNQHQREYTVNKTGHVLIEFRGEKISGAIDFISKIIEFRNITSVDSFIGRIKKCNIEIQPMLAKEVQILNKKIPLLEIEIKNYKPKHDDFYWRNQEYGRKREELKVQLIQNKLMTWQDINQYLWIEEFSKRFPEFKKFEIEFENVRTNWLKMNDNLKILEFSRIKIKQYERKILDFLK